MEYEVTLLAAAERELRKLPPEIRPRLIESLKSLTNPRQPGVRKLQGSEIAGVCESVITE